ncbi:hypothetical protein NL108_015636 [Boleophthalmus pectinirostris]|nr:hypothetical protein NL108_015636 [Boleophthalmus pectinirostris]
MCESSNRAGHVQEDFTPSIITDTANPSVTPEQIIQTVSKLEVIIGFLSGFLLAAVLCCLVFKCHRRKQNNDLQAGDMTETLEMVNDQEEPELNYDTAELSKADTEPAELHYASINFSAITPTKQRKRGEDETTKTEYAEIKRETTEPRQDMDEVSEEISEDKEETAMMKESVPEQQEEVYSNVKEIMDDE